MQLPGGSTRIPPARAPASVLVIINGSNIVSKTVTVKKRDGECSENGGPGTSSDRYIKSKNDRNNDPEDVPLLLIRNRHPETRTTSHRQVTRVTEKPQLMASGSPRRKDRGEE